jgi:hypothetical protein
MVGKNVLIALKNDKILNGGKSIVVFKFRKYNEASSCDENWYSRPVFTDLIER